jgi:hypothetical protein
MYVLVCAKEHLAARAWAYVTAGAGADPRERAIARGHRGHQAESIRRVVWNATLAALETEACALALKLRDSKVRKLAHCRSLHAVCGAN